MRPFRSLWIGGELGHYELACLLSLTNAGYDVGLYTYGGLNRLPSEIQKLDAREIVPEDEIFETASSPGSYSGFSNIFRYKMLQKEEVIWVDTDIMAGPQQMPLDEYLFGFESRRFLNGAVLAAPKDSEFLELLIRRATSIRPADLKWGQIGPKLISAVGKELGLLSYAKPTRTFYPVSYNDLWKLFSPNHRRWAEKRVSGSSTIHLWNEVMRRANGPVKETTPPPGSYLASVIQSLSIESRDPVTDFRVLRRGAARALLEAKDMSLRHSGIESQK